MQKHTTLQWLPHLLQHPTQFHNLCLQRQLSRSTLIALLPQLGLLESVRECCEQLRQFQQALKAVVRANPHNTHNLLQIWPVLLTYCPDAPNKIIDALISVCGLGKDDVCLGELAGVDIKHMEYLKSQVSGAMGWGKALRRQLTTQCANIYYLCHVKDSKVAAEQLANVIPSPAVVQLMKKVSQKEVIQILQQCRQFSGELMVSVLLQIVMLEAMHANDLPVSTIMHKVANKLIYHMFSVGEEMLVFVLVQWVCRSGLLMEKSSRVMDCLLILHILKPSCYLNGHIQSLKQKYLPSNHCKQMLSGLQQTDTIQLEMPHYSHYQRLTPYLCTQSLEYIYTYLIQHKHSLIHDRQLPSLYYRISCSVQLFMKEYGHSYLVEAIIEVLVQLPKHFYHVSIEKKAIPGYQERIVINNRLCEGLLKRQTGLNVIGLYRLSHVQQMYEKQQLSRYLSHTHTFHPNVIETELINLAEAIINKQLEAVVMEVPQLTIPLFFNLIYQLLADGFTLELPIHKLIKAYVVEGVNQPHAEVVKRGLLTAHKWYEVWQEGRGMQPPSLLYFRQVIRAANKQQSIFLQYSRLYSQYGMIKQSIYFTELYYDRQHPKHPTLKNLKLTYELYHKMYPQMQQVSEVMNKLILQHENIKHDQENVGILPVLKENLPVNQQATHKQPQVWKRMLQFYVMNKNAGRRMEMGSVMVGIGKVLMHDMCKMEQSERICQGLQLASMVCWVGEYLAERVDLDEVVGAIKRHKNTQECLAAYELILRAEYRGDPVLRKQYFWECLFDAGEYEALKTLIGRHKQPSSLSTQQLKYLALIAFQNNEHEVVTCYCKYLKDDLPHQLMLPLLQSMYKSWVKVPLCTILTQLKEYINTLKSSELSMSNTESFYEIFKFIMERYPLSTDSERTDVLLILWKYCSIIGMEEHTDVSMEAMHFLLRFLFEKCEEISKYTKIIELKKIHPSIIDANRNYLINSIGANHSHNQFISALLLVVGLRFPVQSCWWIHAMATHCNIPKIYQSSRLSIQRNFHKQDREIEKIGKYLKTELRSLKLQPYYEWIEMLKDLKEGENKSMREIPGGLLSPFNRNIQLVQFISIQKVGDGKSHPRQVKVRGIHSKTKQEEIICFIRKPIEKRKGQNYRIQSNTANFFKETQIIDQQTTYSIEHLSKHLVLIEFVPNLGTLNKLMTDNMQKKQLVKLEKNRNMNEGHEYVFNCLNGKVKFALSRFFFGGPAINKMVSVSAWWERYQNFIKTLAQWSYLGYVVDLGDRHTQNILVQESGKVVHIDFQYIFSEGKILPYPEWVPFRLTKGIVSELSIIEPYGVFLDQFVQAGAKYKQNRRKLWKALGNFGFKEEALISRQISERAELFPKPITRAIEIINAATHRDLLRNMFLGWKSYH